MHLFDYIKKYLFFLLTFIFTVYCFAGAYELIFYDDLPFIQSIAVDQKQDQIKTILRNYTDAEEGMEKVGYTGKPTRLMVPGLNLNLDLIEAHNKDGVWMRRVYGAGYITLNKDTLGKPADILIMTDSSWRTFPRPTDLVLDQDVYVDFSTGVRSVYQVNDKQLLNQSELYIPPADQRRQLVLLVSDENNAYYHAFTLNLQKNT